MKFLAVLAAILLSSATSAATPYRTENIMLLQPDFVLKERAPSVPALSEYIKAVQSAAENALADEQPQPVQGGAAGPVDSRQTEDGHRQPHALAHVQPVPLCGGSAGRMATISLR